MEKLSFYEQVGIVIPGSALLFGLLLLLPELRSLFATGDVSVGGLGLFILIAYAAGHLLAAVGNLIEWIVWKVRGGMPSDWVTHDNPKIVNSQQIVQIEDRVRRRLGLQIEAIKGMPRKQWAPIFGQIYRDVLAHNPGRVETFNGNYGLNRGLAAAALALLSVELIIHPCEWRVSLGLGAVILVYGYRMHRHGVHFAKEAYHRFLSLPAEPPRAPERAK